MDFRMGVILVIIFNFIYSRKGFWYDFRVVGWNYRIFGVDICED